MDATNSNGPVPTFASAKPSLGEASRFWLKLGFISFGGPTGQIAIMHQELVERRRWIGEERFLRALNFCMLLPGPEAQQLATYIGWLLHGTRGGVIAGTLFVLPSAILLWVLSYVYVNFGQVAWIAALFYGLKPAVIAIVLHAVWRIGRRALRTRFSWVLAAGAFVAIFVFHVPFPVIVLGAGLLGLGMTTTRWRNLVDRDTAHRSSAPEVAPLHTAQEPFARPSAIRALRLCIICLLLWFAPILSCGLWLGRDHTIVREGVFFSKAAMVTFGGAYAVLPYVAQQAVERHGWLSAEQMLDGLGLAETTPGPLIMVLQFVGFLGGWRQPGGLSPITAATLGAAMTTWATFVPCFLWILVGAPFVEAAGQNPRMAGALSAITAAVVGVVLNLAVWFAGDVLFSGSEQIDWFAVAVAVAALILLWREIVGVVPIVFAGALAGMVFDFLRSAS